MMSDGARVYACTSPDEVIDLVAGGQGVFGIALGKVWQEVEGSIAALPVSSDEDEAPAGTAGPDELASRRARRIS